MGEEYDVELDESLQNDIRDVGSISLVTSLLEIICRTTQMRFSAVARVTDTSWTALAIRDDLSFGLGVGGHLDINSTLCKESRAARLPVVIEHASIDPIYRDHHTPRLYKIESYVSVPIILSDGEYFGNLCALDPLPTKVREPHVIDMFVMFAAVLASHLDNIRTRRHAQAAATREQEAGVLRERFVAVLGHDLRNPLSSLASGVEVLRRASNDAAVVERIAELMGRSVRRMTGLVNDLMDFSRGRFGDGVGLAFNVVTDLEQAFSEVIEELRVIHPNADVNADFLILAPVRCDRPRLQQLLSNLVANALKHGDHDSPVLVRGFLTEGGSDLLLLVENDGPPIPQERRAQIFEPFVRGDGRSSGEGLGLGLFICSQIVKGHGGVLEVSSEPGRRTVFKAHIPIR